MKIRIWLISCFVFMSFQTSANGYFSDIKNSIKKITSQAGGFVKSLPGQILLFDPTTPTFANRIAELRGKIEEQEKTRCDFNQAIGRDSKYKS